MFFRLLQSYFCNNIFITKLYTNVRAMFYFGAVPWLRRLVAGLSPRKSGFVPAPVLVVFLWTKWQVGSCDGARLCFSTAAGGLLYYPRKKANVTE
jgi:hypothetical protein